VAANMLARRSQAKAWDWTNHVGLKELELFGELSYRYGGPLALDERWGICRRE